MSIKPRDFSRDITVGGEIQRERNHQDNRETVDTWSRATNSPYGENAREASPAFNPIDPLIPARYNTIKRNENWKWYRAHKPEGYDLTANTPGIGVDPNLVQIGNTPFWRSSNEPVEPWDCERWPNSPYCGGSVGNPFGTVSSTLIIPSSTSCETCITWQPNFLGIPGPVSRVCYRKDSEYCKVPIVEQANDPPIYPPGARVPHVPVPVAPDGKVRFLACGNASKRIVSISAYVTNNNALNAEEQLELAQLKADLIRPLSEGMIAASQDYYVSFSYEPGICRVQLEDFSTVGYGLTSTGGETLRDYGLLPWTNTSYVPVGIHRTVLYPVASYRRLISSDNTKSTPGYTCITSKRVDYPPLLEQTETLSGGSIVNITISESYIDFSVVVFIDFDCQVLRGKESLYPYLGQDFVSDYCRWFQPDFGAYGSLSVGLLDKQASYNQSGDIPELWLAFASVRASSQCPIPPIPPTLPKEDDPMDCCDEVLEQIELLHLKNNKVYNILGGDRWFKGDSETPDLDIDAETAINTVRSNLYRDDTQADSETVSATDLISLLAAYQAVLYQRSGFHRFPALVPENLALDPNDGNDADLSIVDAMSWQEWLVKQIDALMGAWPIKVKYKDEEGEESEIELHNNSEAIAEVYGLLLSVAGDVDIQTELAFKTITEAIAAKVAATTATDYAKGNAEFLGYKGNLKQKKIPTSITPGADTLKKALETSEQKVARWENEDKLDLVELCTRILFAAEVVKSAFWDTFDPERGLRGEGIKDLKEQGSAGEEESWQQFIDELRNPAGVRYSDLFPRPDINNLPQEERDGN